MNGKANAMTQGFIAKLNYLLHAVTCGNEATAISAAIQIEHLRTTFTIFRDAIDDHCATWFALRTMGENDAAIHAATAISAVA